MCEDIPKQLLDLITGENKIMILEAYILLIVAGYFDFSDMPSAWFCDNKPVSL